MTKLRRCNCGKDGVEASVFTSGFITVPAECLDSSLLGKSSTWSLYNCSTNDGNSMCDVWPPESHQGWHMWILFSTPSYQGLSLPREWKFCFFTPVKGRVNVPSSKQRHRFMLGWEMLCRGCHVHAVVWAHGLTRVSWMTCKSQLHEPSQLSFLVQSQNILIVLSSVLPYFCVCLPENMTGRRKFQMAAGNTRQLKEGARSSCLKHDHCSLFPLVLWDYSHLAPAMALNIYLMPLQSQINTP